MVGHWINTTNILEFEMKPLINDHTIAIFGREMLKKRMSVGKLLRLLDDMKLLHIGEVAEQAKSKTSGIALCKRNTPGKDFVNGVQCKHVKTWPEPKHTGIRASLSPTSSKGPLSVTVTETITDKQWYFWIPLADAQKAHCIKFTFNADGSPRVGKGRSDSYLPDWWDYKVKDYKTLCKMIKEYREPQ